MIRLNLRSGSVVAVLLVASWAGGALDASVARAADAPAAAAPAAAAGGGTSIAKYAPSYVLMVVAISLGLFAVCRPAGFSLAAYLEKAAEKKPEKK